MVNATSLVTVTHIHTVMAEAAMQGGVQCLAWGYFDMKGFEPVTFQLLTTLLYPALPPTVFSVLYLPFLSNNAFKGVYEAHTMMKVH